MLSYLHSYFTTIKHDPLLEHKHTKKHQSKYTNRNELIKNAMSPNKLRRRAYRKISEAKSPLLQREGDQEEEKIGKTKVVDKEKNGIRVKVRMTKEEAVQLLSKCKNGGLLEFGDVAHELSKIPVNRISVVNSPTIVRDRVLYSISEDI